MQIELIKYKCCYCGHDIEQDVITVLSGYMCSSFVHGFDYEKTSNITECPNCGFVSYYLINKIPGITEDTIDMVNKEYEGIYLAISNNFDLKGISQNTKDLIRCYIKYFLLLLRAEHRDINEMAKCLYDLNDYYIKNVQHNFVEINLLNRFLEVYKSSNIFDINILDLLRTFGCFSFVLGELEHIDYNETSSSLIELEKECCRKQINMPLYKRDIKWIEENGLDETFVKQCSFCGEDLCFEEKEFLKLCEKCGKMDKRASRYFQSST